MTEISVDAKTRNRNSWSRYWATRSVHSLAGTFDAGYGDAIGRFWREACQGLPSSAEVLDIATGNGALPRLLLDWRHDLRIDAIDAADISPDWIPAPGAEKPRFHSTTICEHLPFADGSFHVVTSQYGIEYSDVQRSLSEIARVLRSGGRFAAIMHDSDSRITRVAREEHEHARLLLAPGGALECVRAMFPLLALAASEEGRQQLNSDPTAIAARSQFNDSMQRVKHAAAEAIAPDLLAEFLQWTPRVLTLAGGHAPPSIAAQHCDNYQLQLEDGLERYRALLDAALDADKRRDLIEQLRALGFTTSGFSDVSHDGYKLGISLVAQLD